MTATIPITLPRQIEVEYDTLIPSEIATVAQWRMHTGQTSTRPICRV